MKQTLYLLSFVILFSACQNNTNTSEKIENKDSLVVVGESVSKELSELNLKISLNELVLLLTVNYVD